MMPVSVVTGAAGAMGSACAQTLGASSDVLLLTDRDEAGLAATAAVLEAEGTTVVTIVGDVADPLVIDALVRQVTAYGRLRALVHTAGLSPSMAGWEEILRVDLAGVARLLDAFAPARGAGERGGLPRVGGGPHGRRSTRRWTRCSTPRSRRTSRRRFQSCLGTEPDPGVHLPVGQAWRDPGLRAGRGRRGAPRGGRVVSLSPGLIDTGMGRLELADNPIKDRTWPS